MNYFDSSALLKLLFEEPESPALERWLSAVAHDLVVTSEIARIEVIRSVRRIDADTLPAARSLLSQLDVVPLAGAIVIAAAEVSSALLRTLDAIHLASALSIRADLNAFVCYDLRLSEAAASAGLPAASPR